MSCKVPSGHIDEQYMRPNSDVNSHQNTRMPNENPIDTGIICIRSIHPNALRSSALYSTHSSVTIAMMITDTTTRHIFRVLFFICESHWAVTKLQKSHN